MRGDSHADHDDCHSGCCNKSSQAKPFSRPLEASRSLADLSYHVPGEEWRKLGLGSTAENIPQLFVIFRFHSLQSIELTAAPEVALGMGAENDTLDSGRFKETFELSDTGRMPHFAQRFCFDLTNPLAGDLELPAYFLQRSAVAIDQAQIVARALAAPDR